MKEHFITHHSSAKYWVGESDFEEAFYNSKLNYSLRHLAFDKNISQEIITEALQKSLQICVLAVVNSKHHFKKIFVFDVNTKSLYEDWLMSKKGFNLMIMQIPLQNKNIATWLWKLTEL